MDIWDVIWPDSRDAIPPTAAMSAAFVGGGGKTAALARIAFEARARGVKALLAVTTKWWNPPAFPGVLHITLSGDETAGTGRGVGPYPDIDGTAPPAIFSLSGPPTPDGNKVTGVDPAWLETTARGRFTAVEAEGARGRPFKVPGKGEPVVPLWVDIVVCVTGLPALGVPISPETVHRVEAIRREIAETDSFVTPAVVAHLLASPRGMFKGTPGGARRVWLINQADTADDAQRAKAFVEAVLKTFADRGNALPVDTVAITSLQSDDPIRFVIERGKEESTNF